MRLRNVCDTARSASAMGLGERVKSVVRARVRVRGRGSGGFFTEISYLCRRIVRGCLRLSIRGCCNV
jgi:hypothetical protein